MKFIGKYFFSLLLLISLGNLKAQSCFTVSKNEQGFTKAPVILDGLVFQLSKKEINPVSYPCLDSLAVFLHKNDSLVIKVRVHQDSRTALHESKMSRNISQARAHEVMQYLLTKGIKPERMVAEGMGSREPLVSQEEIAAMRSKEEIEAAYQRNRRTDFIILSAHFRKD